MKAHRVGRLGGNDERLRDVFFSQSVFSVFSFIDNTQQLYYK